MNRINQILKSAVFILAGFVLSGCGKNGERPEPEPVEVPLIERMMISVATAEDGLSVKLPFPMYDNDCRIDWGDGISEKTTQPYPAHVYARKGKYLVMVSGTVSSLGSYSLDESERLRISAVYNWGKTGLKSMNSAFTGCAGLTYLTPDDQRSFADVRDFSNAFSGCSGLTEIPEGLFQNATSATTFSNTFSGCTGLKKIPGGLFDNCAKVENFQSVFKNCENLTEIPIGLFDACTWASDFGFAFQNCGKLTGIPSGLFDNNKEVNNFLLTFAGCVSVTGESPYTLIGEDKVYLYDRDGNSGGFKKPAWGWACFSECTGLSDFQAIPDSWK